VASPLLPLTRARAALIRQLLQDKPTRAREGAFVLEGAKFCLDLIRFYPASILSLLLSSRYLQSEDEVSRTLRSTLVVGQYTCSDATFEALSGVETPQGVLAIVRQPEWDEADVLDQPLLLGLYGDRLRDPANVGTIIRTAAALNLAALWLTADSADCFAPKVVRATAGAVMTLPIFYRSEALPAFAHHRCEIYSAVVPSPDAVSLGAIRQVPGRVIIAVGNEGAGLAGEVQQASTVRFCIPLARGVESLNVAATVAIAAFHLGGLQQSSRPTSVREQE
jgi:TrmH family RNA methyltransferase